MSYWQEIVGDTFYWRARVFGLFINYFISLNLDGKIHVYRVHNKSKPNVICL